MISLKKRQEGFTIVELLIVIVVIGILAAIVITTYAGIQAKARNAKRQTDLNSVQTNLEAYFQSNGHYPSYADLNSPTWVAANMKSLDLTALLDPSATCVQSSTTNCLVNAATAPTSAGNYDYYPVDSTGSSANCEATDTTCTAYTLTATYEGSSPATYDVKHNLD